MTRIHFDWAPARQVLAFGDEVFTHDGPPGTRAEHDVAHLLIAHNGRLPWRPSGTREDVCFAEFNAVHLEVLLNEVLRENGPDDVLDEHLSTVLPRVLPHMQWFAETHYAPFPCSFAEALARFWAALRPARLAPLLPWYQYVQQVDQTARLVAEYDL